MKTDLTVVVNIMLAYFFTDKRGRERERELKLFIIRSTYRLAISLERVHG